MIFELDQKVLFKFCDPAGIVFFPRYFEMMNDCVETFFDQALGLPFETLLQRAGIPTVQIQTEFLRPSRHGDLLTLRLVITRIGRSSVAYRMTAHCRDERRFETTATLVYVDQTGKPQPWPKDLRATLSQYEVPDAP